jgi:hypothetical protein
MIKDVIIHDGTTPNRLRISLRRTTRSGDRHHLGPPALFLAERKADDPELRLGVEACRLVGLDPDQLSTAAAAAHRAARIRPTPPREQRGRIP